MAEVGGMLAAAILKVVGEQIGSAIGGQITLLKDFEEDLKEMKMALESVEAVLKVAERRSLNDALTRLWLKRLTGVMYAISDMIDEFETDMQAITKPSTRKFSFKQYLAIIIPCLTIGPNITMANRMKKMRDDLEIITNQHKAFTLVEPTNANVSMATEPGSTIDLGSQIIEWAEEKDKILASLSQSMTEDITVLPIYGIAGLGKTTMAKMVCNSPQFNEYSLVWVHVSQTFDVIKIGNSIISQLSEKQNESDYTGKQMILNSLQKLIANKKILIVLDDLWEGDKFHLEKLVDMLKVGKGSSVVVIVTTRDEGIADKIATIKPHKLAPLTNDQCWNIIKKNCDFESRNDKEQCEEIGKDIAMKCAGVALAAKSLGHMLKFMKYDQWESVKNSNIWTASPLKDTSSTKVLASLMLSYIAMPSYLKLCFVYCAIFPKGHKIVKDDLIHQWVSLGFATWQLGEKCIMQLLGLSFLEHSKSLSTTESYDEDLTLLTMHDLVHDLARSVMDDEILVVEKGVKIEGICYHYALLDDCSKPLGPNSSKIRALRYMKSDKIELRDNEFSSAKSLRVLDLSECSIHKLPDSIGVLKQLRYLNAPRVQDAKIPDSCTKLSKLLYLNLHESPKILALPESIGEMQGLLYLDLSGCSGIKRLPKSFGGLKSLVHLDLSKCSCIEGTSMFLGSLTQLQYLNLSYCSNIGGIPEALGGLSKLQHLNLSSNSYLESCQEAEFLGTLTKLKYLNLSSKSCDLQKLPEALSGFNQLKYLNLSGCSEMTKLPRLFGNLTNLAHLDLSHCGKISNTSEALFGLNNLQYLNVTNSSVPC